MKDKFQELVKYYQVILTQYKSMTSCVDDRQEGYFAGMECMLERAISDIEEIINSNKEESTNAKI